MKNTSIPAIRTQTVSAASHRFVTISSVVGSGGGVGGASCPRAGPASVTSSSATPAVPAPVRTDVSRGSDLTTRLTSRQAAESDTQRDRMGTPEG